MEQFNQAVFGILKHPGLTEGDFFEEKNVEMGDFPCIDVIDELEGVE